MCDAPADELMQPKIRSQPNQLQCIKCKDQRSAIKLRNVRYCRDCFLYVFEGRFRSILNRADATNDKNKKNMLIGFSGGPSSRAMLQLLYNFTKNHNKFGQFTVIFIDESILLNNKLKSEVLEDIEQITLSYNFEFSSIKIESIFGLETEELNQQKFLEIMNDLPNLTAKEDMLQNFRHVLLMNAAKQTNSSMILLGDSLTRIAIKTISLTSKGRGFSLPFEIATESNIYDGITILRPMRDQLDKEIAFYNHYHQLKLPFITNLYTKQSIRASIQSLTEAFIVGLDADFPSTVPTVVRTANKLRPHPQVDSKLICPFCLNPKQPGISIWKSKVMLKSLNSEFEEANEVSINSKPLDKLCYGCQLILDEPKMKELPSRFNLRQNE